MDSQPSLPVLDLKDLKLSRMKKMSHVWKWNCNKFLHQSLQPFPFQNLTNIYLSKCRNMKYLFSPLMAIYLSNLKSVEIKYCDGMEEVISGRDDENEENALSASSHRKSTFFPRLEHVSLNYLPRLKSIDTADARHSGDQFSNNFTNTIHDQFQSGQAVGACLSFLQHPTMLQELVIYNCEKVMEVFMFSTLESLKQLKKLKVVGCNAMQVVVKEESETSLKVVVFPRLETLVLDDLPNLKSFFLGMNEFRWPLLDDVMVNDCPQMTTFTNGHSKTPKLKHIRTQFGKYSLERGLNFLGTINQNTLVATSSSDASFTKGMPPFSSFHNMVEARIDEWRGIGRSSIIPSNALQQLENLEKIIIIDGCPGVKEVFELVVDEKSFNEVQNVVQIPNLKEVVLLDVYDVKYLWKSNQWMVLEFPNLTTLFITSCHKLEHVFTSSMVGSLVQLQSLHIWGCNNIEVIVKEEEEEDDAKVNEIITLPSLRSLQLLCLPSLKGFCLGNKSFSFPALDDLRCPANTDFTKGPHLSTPILQVIETSFGWHRVTEGGLNSFIKTKQQEGNEF